VDTCATRKNIARTAEVFDRLVELNFVGEKFQIIGEICFLAGCPKFSEFGTLESAFDPRELGGIEEERLGEKGGVHEKVKLWVLDLVAA